MAGERARSHRHVGARRPPGAVDDSSERRTARLLSRLLIVMLPIAWFSAIAQFADDGSVDSFDIALGLAILALPPITSPRWCSGSSSPAGGGSVIRS